jgi:Derlin-2/3
MDFNQWYHSLPKFTRTYLVSVFIVTFCVTYVKSLPVFYYFALSFEMAFSHFQIWRLITNFFIVGKFSFNFLFFMMMM